MIRSKPSTDEYREAWERVFGKPSEPVEKPKKPTHAPDGTPLSWFVGGELVE